MHVLKRHFPFQEGLRCGDIFQVSGLFVAREELQYHVELFEVLYEFDALLKIKNNSSKARFSLLENI